MAKKYVPRHASYLSDPFTDLSGIVNKARCALKGVKFEAFAGTGLSGTMIVPLLAYSMKKRFAIVRKCDDKDNHSQSQIESGLFNGDRWVFIDDFTTSGITRSRVVRIMEEHHHSKLGFHATFVGQYLYNTSPGFQESHTLDIPRFPDTLRG